MSYWTELVPEDDLEDLLKQLPSHSKNYKRLMDEFWIRHSKPLPAWLVKAVPIGKPIHDLKFIWFCSKASSPRDDGHRPNRTLLKKHPEGDYQLCECSCGVRDGDDSDMHGIDSWWRAPGGHWWPHRGTLAEGTYQYGVCPYSKYIDSQDHAPVWLETPMEGDPVTVRCACRRVYALGPLSEYETRSIPQAKWMEAQ